MAHKSRRRTDRCRGRDTSPTRLLRSCARWMFWSRRGRPWRMRSARLGSPRSRLRDELLDGEIFYTLREAKVVTESWRRHYNTKRPHAALGYKPPAPEVFVPTFAAWPAAPPRPAPPARHPTRSAHHRPALTSNPDPPQGADQLRAHAQSLGRCP